MNNAAGVGARLGLSGTLEFRDAEGRVLKTVEISGSVPLSDTGLSVEQAQEFINSQGATNGTDNRK